MCSHPKGDILPKPEGFDSLVLEVEGLRAKAEEMEPDFNEYMERNGHPVKIS